MPPTPMIPMLMRSLAPMTREELAAASAFAPSAAVAPPRNSRREWKAISGLYVLLKPAEKHHAGCHGYIQRRNPSRHGNPQQHIAVFLHQIVQALAFGPHYDDALLSPRNFVVGGVATLVQSVNKISEVLQYPQCLVNIDCANDGQILERARRRFGDNVGQAGCPPLGYHHPARARRMRGPNDRA